MNASGRPTLIGIDPVTFQVDVQTDPMEVENVISSSVATAGGSVWLGFRGLLVEFDPHTGETLDIVSLDVSVDGLASTGLDMWIVDELQQSLFRFDTASGEIGHSVELSGAPDEVAVEPEGTLWVLDELGGTLTRIDPTGEADAPVNVASDPVDVAVGGGSVWVADADEGSVREIDPVTLEIRQTVDLPGEPAVLGVDPRTGDVWVYLS